MKRGNALTCLSRDRNVADRQSDDMYINTYSIPPKENAAILLFVLSIFDYN